MSALARVRRGVGLRRTRLAVTISAALLAIFALSPASAIAHGIVGKTDLPIPRWLFAWAAAVVLVLSFLALAALWPKPKLEHLREREVLRLPRLLDPLAGLIGIALFAVVVYAGLAGEQQDATANLAPTFIYVLFWVGLAFASLFFGDVFRAFNPWRAFARGVSWVATRVRGGTAGAEALPYPAWLGRWPAMIGILGFAWLELVYASRDRPSILAWLALGYAAVQLVGMSLYGIEAWTDRADAFSVYFGIFARLSPLHWTHGRLSVRPPAVGIVNLDMMPGTVALLTTMIGTTSFDGFSNSSLWVSNIQPTFSDWFSDLGANLADSLQLASTVGLLCMVALIAVFYRLGVIGMRSIGGGHEVGELSRRFAHSLAPIAFAYVAAHYYSLLVYQSQALGYLISDPLGNGSNIFGTASAQINYNVISANSVWYVQVAALVIGHVTGLMLAHDRALIVYKRPRDAIRSQYWMLAVMVGFTSLGLWILSAAAVQ